MKKALLSTIFVLFVTTAFAQVNVKQNQKAKTYIEQARKYAAKEEYGQVAHYLQMAYDITPTMLACKDLQLLGLSYYMMENAPLAIKFLELAANCETNKKSLAHIYTHLGYSYEDIEDYNKAEQSLQKAIDHTTSNEEIAVIYEDLAQMHFDNEQPHKTIRRMKQSIDHYLKHLSITEEDVMMGSVKNEELGRKYFTLTWFASSFEMQTQANESVIKSALTGNRDAIKYCTENNIDYRRAIVLPQSTNKEDQAAQALIDQAATHISKREYKAAITNLQKAYTTSPSLFDGKVFMMWGLSYAMTNDNALAIQYLNRALNYSLEKKELYLLYSALSQAHHKRGDYNKAVINAERSLYLASNDKEVLDCSLKLASSYFALDDIEGTIESLQNAIRYYMRINSIANDEVMKGNVKNKFLASNHMRLAKLLNQEIRGDEAKKHLRMAALCGSEVAREALEDEELGMKN